MLWESAEDTHHELVTNAMRRDRFDAIFSNFHLSDIYNLDKTDKFAKIRPLVKILNTKFLQNSPIEEFYSFDESMCEYFGRHGCKQFIKGKPIRFGFKIWCGTTTLGYLVWFKPYQGKTGNDFLRKEEDCGLGGNLVRTFANVLQGREQKPYYLSFDNFFTSVKLVSALKTNN